MGRIATSFIVADMVKNGDVFMNLFGKRDSSYPSKHKSMNQNLGAKVSNSTISSLIKIACPIPTSRYFINGNFRKKSGNHLGVKDFYFEDVVVHVPHLTYNEINVNPLV